MSDCSLAAPQTLPKERMKIMEWILIAGALCLSTNHDICIHIHMHNAQSAPYTLDTPVNAGFPYWTLNSAKADGESVASEINEFNPK
jgi:hypothetical protein